MRRFALAVALLAMGCHPRGSATPIEGPALVFDDVRVFDGEVDRGVLDVVVRDGVIVSLGQVDLSTKVEGVTVIDGRGKTLVPGLIDSHAHVQSRDQLEQAAAFGVTTVLDMFMDEITMRAIKREQAKGKLAGAADLRSSGILATAPGGHGTEYGFEFPTLESADQAEAWVADRVEAGVDYIKIVYDDGHAAGIEFGNLDPDTLEAVIAAAHAHDLRAVVHVSDLAAAKQALRAGADGLAHVWFDAPADDEVIALLQEHDAFVVGTLAVIQGFCGDPRVTEVLRDDAIASLLDPVGLTDVTAAYELARARDRPCSDAVKAVGQLHEAGIDLLAGTDIPNFGLPAGAALHADLALLVDAGLSPIEAMRSATKTPAERFGLSDRGRIAPGARADLVLVDGDPIADIADLRRIAAVWKAGQPIDLDARRLEIADARAELDARKSAPPPVGSESGLISDFESDLTARFGAPWQGSTDAMIGGKSTVELDQVERGAEGSAGALRIRGTVVDGARGWAGASFFPGVDQQPANLSSKHVLRFRASGTPGTHAVMFFGSSPLPRQASFELPDAKGWTAIEIDLDVLEVPTWDIVLIFIGTTTPGTFELQIDDVRLD